MYKNIRRVLSANIIQLITGIVIGFVVPAVLTVNGYADLKTFTFYLGYVGILHFGFVDGLYIKYGGCEASNIDSEELKNEHFFLMLMQSVISLLLIAIALVIKDSIFLMVSLIILPVNMGHYYKLFYQATGQFKEYAKVLIIYNVIYLFGNVLLAIIIKSDAFMGYCVVVMVAHFITFIIFEYRFYIKTRRIRFKITLKHFNIIKVGIFIMLGNLAVNMFYAIDRWFVKIFFEDKYFAYYSFAIAMLNIVNLMINAIVTVLYNYIAKNENKDELSIIKNELLLLGCFASAMFFPLKAIVSLLLEKYIPSLNIIAISFAAYPYMIIINAIYVNLYKARKNEKRYLRVVVLMLIISTIYNAVALLFKHSVESIAFATTLSFITWFIYSGKDFSYLKPRRKELLFMMITTVSFIIVANNLDWIIGAMVYVCILILNIFIFYRKIAINILHKVITSVNK